MTRCHGRFPCRLGWRPLRVLLVNIPPFRLYYCPPWSLRFLCATVSNPSMAAASMAILLGYVIIQVGPFASSMPLYPVSFYSDHLDVIQISLQSYGNADSIDQYHLMVSKNEQNNDTVRVRGRSFPGRCLGSSPPVSSIDSRKHGWKKKL